MNATESFRRLYRDAEADTGYLRDRNVFRDGIDIPRWVQLKMEGFLDDTASIRAFGLDVVTRLCERLIEGGAPGIHFYTMNQSALTLELCKRLKLGPGDAA